MSFDFDEPRNGKFGGSLDRHGLSVSASDQWCNNVLVIVSNRFGLNSIGPEYFSTIKKYMKLPSFIGLVGGKPRFAYYFVGQLEKPAGLSEESKIDDDRFIRQKNGWSEDEEVKYDEADRLVFLDPHYVNAQIDFSAANLAEQEHLYHCK